MSQVVDQVIDEYLNTLKYRQVAHPRLLISFSAVPGSGKTTLAKRLAEDLQAQYIRADDIRYMLQTKGVDPVTLKISDIARKITQRIIDHDENKCVILDASIDRTWPEFFERAEKMNMPTCIIRLTIPPEEVKRRLIERDGHGKDEADMKKFRADFDVCRDHIEADIELYTQYDYVAVLRKISQKLN